MIYFLFWVDWNKKLAWPTVGLWAAVCSYLVYTDHFMFHIKLFHVQSIRISKDRKSKSNFPKTQPKNRRDFQHVSQFPSALLRAKKPAELKQILRSAGRLT